MVQVVYATAEQQWRFEVPYRSGLTVMDAILESGIQAHTVLPEPLMCGVFGHRVDDLQQQVEEGDRIEIYRPLLINPKDIRRKRAEKNPVGVQAKGNRFKQLKP